MRVAPPKRRANEMKTGMRPPRLARKLSVQISLVILFASGSTFADSLPPASGYIYASGSHAPGGGCAGACVPTPGSGSLSYHNSGGGGSDGVTYTWSESADVTASLGPGIPAVGTVYATGAASVGGNWLNNQANGWGGAFSTFYFSVDQIKVPSFAPIVLPIYFEADGEAHVDGYGSYDVWAAILSSTPVSYSIAQEGQGISGSFSKTTTVDLQPNTAYAVQIGAEGSAFAEFGLSSSRFVAGVDPTFGFDQTAFDAMYGSKSFPLAEYYSLDFSPNVPASSAPEPNTALLFGTFFAGLVGVLTACNRKTSVKA